MKTRFFFASLVAAAGMMLINSCTYDDSNLRDRMDEFDSRLTELEKTVKEMNTNVGSLMTIVNALQTQVKIENIEKLPDGTGYVIHFSDKNTITVTNGKDGDDGDDGKTPAITVGKWDDGQYYWKVNGEWLMDGENMIPATSKTEIPQIRVNEETGHFELSFDGQKWQDIGSAGGAGIFKDVIDGEDEVTFILAGDKEPIVIPKAQKFALVVDSTSIPVDNPGSSIGVSFKVIAADEGTIVDAVAIGGFIVERIESQMVAGELHGTVTINIPNPIPDGKVYLTAVNGNGTPSMRILSFEKGEMKVEVLGEVKVKAEGGEIILNVMTNYNYTVEVPEWITYKVESMTKAVRNEFIILTILKNEDAQERTATVTLLDGITPRHNIEITQEGASIDEPGYKGPIEDWKDDGSIDF